MLCSLKKSSEAMPIRRSPNDARYPRPQPGRDPLDWASNPKAQMNVRYRVMSC